MHNILNFPKTTIVDKPVPKKAFYGRSYDSALREFLTREFESIIWLYKLAATTLNVADGKLVHEIDVFYCRMKADYYSLNPFCAMDKILPRHTLFIIDYGETKDMMMHHKEMTVVHNEQKWKCGVTELKRNINLEVDKLTINGLDLDAVYNSLLSQISGLNVSNEEEYKEQVELRKKIENVKKQIDMLQKKIRLEKQFNRQIEMNTKARQLKRELQKLQEKLKD